jgi:hypothetical protein
VLGSASGLLRKPAVGGEVPGGGGSALGLGGSSLSARPDLPRDAMVHPADGSASLAAAPRSRFPRGLLTVAPHDGAGSEPQRLPPAPGGQGQAPKKLPETDAIFANLAEQAGQAPNGRDGRREGAEHAPEHRLSSHREYRGLLTGWNNPRQYPSGRPR